MATLRRIRRSSPTVGPTWVREFSKELVAEGLSAATRRTYVYDVLAFARWMEEVEVTLAALTAVDLVTYKHHLTDRLRLKTATVNHRLQALRRLCRWAVSHRLLEADPSAALRAARVAARRRPAGLTEPDVHRLFRAAGQGRALHRLRDYAILQLLVQAGLRVGELVSLRVGDLTVHPRSGHVRVHFGKGGKEREVPLNASARRAINAYLAIRGEGEPAAALFVSMRNTPLSLRSVQSILSVLSRRAKIEPTVTPHRLRHTFAINYLRAHPGQLVELANLLGHDSLDTTAIYTQPSAEELAANLEASPLNVH